MRINYREVLEFYRNKRVLITGNTGFKGSWMTYILLSAGAKVIGYSLYPPTKPALFDILGLEGSEGLQQYYEDVRDLDKLKSVFAETQPELVFHLAAQPIVRDSYKDPVNTYSVNVMGTVNVCECVRLSHTDKEKGGIKYDSWDGVRSFLNVTTDKVYKNTELDYAYREEDPLDGYDPYSNSKSCSELVTHSYINSFYGDDVAVSTARAGNVIGGGDFSNDRIIPDCVRAIIDAKKGGEILGQIEVRNPDSIRPFQHVLEPIFIYLTIAMEQNNDPSFQGFYNVGPDNEDCITTRELVTKLCDSWKAIREDLPGLEWIDRHDSKAPHEAGFLKLNCDLLKKRFDWKPVWNIDRAIEETANWLKVFLKAQGQQDRDASKLIRSEMDREIELFMAESQVN